MSTVVIPAPHDWLPNAVFTLGVGLATFVGFAGQILHGLAAVVSFAILVASFAILVRRYRWEAEDRAERKRLRQRPLG
jgi:membrane protein implicated in regulation of membrane protease activity